MNGKVVDFNEFKQKKLKERPSCVNCKFTRTDELFNLPFCMQAMSPYTNEAVTEYNICQCWAKKEL